MKVFMMVLFCVGLCWACTQDVEKFGEHFKRHGDLESLRKATELIPVGVDTVYVKAILGEPVDFGFDIRYYTDSVGEMGSPIGAVFGIDTSGIVTWRDVFEIGE